MTDDELVTGKRVVYVPRHAGGDRNHPDCEHGVITQVSTEWNIRSVATSSDGIRPVRWAASEQGKSAEDWVIA